MVVHKDNAGITQKNPTSWAQRIHKAASVSIAVVLATALGSPFLGSAYASGSDDSSVSVENEEISVPEFKGSILVQKFLKGYKPTLEELKTIDFVALTTWNSQVSKKLKAYYDELLAKQEEQLPAPTPAPDTENSNVSDNVTSVPDEDDKSDNPLQGDSEAADGNETLQPIDPATEDTASNADLSASVSVQVPVQDENVIVDAVSNIADPFDVTQTYPQWNYTGSTEYEVIRYTEDIDSQKFIASIGELARDVAQQYNISASEMIGLAVAMSDSGRMANAQAPVRNLFDAKDYVVVEIPGFDENGVADESLSQVKYELLDTLCEYKTYRECLEDRAQRVASGWEESIPDDGTWGGPLGSLTNRVQKAIEDYDLTRYDEELDFKPVVPLTVTVQTDIEGVENCLEVGLVDLVSEITSHLGVPYVWGGTTPEGFDCSGLVQYAYSKSLQIDIPRTTYYQCLVGEDVNFNELHMGDLLFFTKNGVVGHVGMYLGEGCYIEAPKPGMEVKLTAMEEKLPSFAKRLIPTQDIPEPNASSVL